MAAYPAWQATIVTEAGDIQPGAQVDVVLESTGLVPAGGIWSNRAGSSALANPFFADANGFAQFYAAPGEYRITATGVGGTRVWRYVVLDGTASIADVTTSATDTTAGRLLKVGDFGLGASTGTISTLVTLDSAKTGGFFRYGGTDPDNPFPIWDEFGHLLVIRATDNALSQIAFRNSNSQNIAKRYYNGTVWSAWIEIYHTGNILTTGTPSTALTNNAIFESGTGFTKFADGTMICSGESYDASCSVTTAVGTFFRFDAGLLNFPATFVGDVEFTATSRDSGTTAWLSCRPRTSTSTTTVGLRFYSDQSATRNINTEWMAIGRWF